MDIESDADVTDWAPANKDLAGAISTVSNDAAENDYSWLDLVDEDNCFMPLDLSDSRPSKSLDFGCNGYTGSLSTWHELLQITAPDSQCGLVFVRGDFPDNPDSILARAQRRNQKGTFGMTIRIPPTQDWAQEPTAAQGLINLRWPYTRFNWVTNNELGGDPFATFTVCSFVDDGTVYQIARIVPTRLSQPSPSPSSVELRSCGGPNQVHCHATEEKAKAKAPIRFTIDVGGVIRFGCPSTIAKASNRFSKNHNASPDTAGCLVLDNFSVSPENPKSKAQVFSCTSGYHRKKLEIRLWVNRVAQELSRHECDLAHRHNEVASLHVRKDVEFNDKEITVIVAAFRLADSDSKYVMSKDAISYEKVLRHLGVSDDSVHAPYRLWSTMLGFSSGVDSFELNAIARSVEAILNVAALPIPYAETVVPAQLQPDSGSVTSRQQLASRIALLRNIITPQIVDLESAFWQVRLLVIAAKRLESDFPWPPRSNLSDLKKMQFDAMKVYYRKKIVSYVRGFCLWVLDLFDMIENFFGPSIRLRDPGVGILASDILVGQKTGDSVEHCCGSGLPNAPIGDQKYYGSIIVWYVLNCLPEVFNDFSAQEQLWSKFSGFAGVQTTHESKSKRASVHIDDPNGCIIRWYHNHSLLRICQKLQAMDADRFDRVQSGVHLQNADQPTSGHTSTDAGGLLEELEGRSNNWQAKAEKAMRLFEQGRLRDHELGHETASLTKVGEELQISITAITTRGRTCLELTTSLLHNRTPTKKLHAGRSHIQRWDPQHDIRSANPRPAPWELSCLAQYMPRLLGVSGFNKDKCLERVREFMLSDYSFMGSWDPSKLTTIGQWWDYVTTSIICADLLHEDERQENGQQTSSAVDKGLELLRDIRQLQKNKIEGVTSVFPWRRLKPKKVFHSDSAVLSVEDTPEIHKMYQRPGADVLAIRLNLKRYFDDNFLPKYNTLQTITSNIGASKLHNLSCLDIALATGSNDHPETTLPIVRGRADEAFWKDWKSQDIARTELFALFAKEGAEALKDLYLIGKAAEHPYYKKHQELLEDTDMRKALLTDYQQRLFVRLNDCLVDQNVKYRVIFAKRLSPVTVQAMVYMWHPEAIDTFDDHLGELSSFRNITEQSVTGGENTWISSITIKHWRLLSYDESLIRKAEKEVDEEEMLGRWENKGAGSEGKRWAFFRRHKKPLNNVPHPTNGDTATKQIEQRDTDRDFPPPGVRDDRPGPLFLLWNMHEINKIHELSVSMAITGDAMGRSWTCSIICELFEEEEVIKYTNEASYILQMFIHQQDSARSLVFLMFLGYICLALAKECDRFMDQLNGVMRLDSQVLLNGLEWEKSDRALKKLKQMLWGYESLRGFGDMLNKAIEEVGKARDRMNKLLEDGSAIRHEDMKSAALQIQEEFEKKFSHLETAYHTVQQRVEQGYKLREGITSVLGVEQNENISMLTWLTIIYLGPTLVVGIFGMSNNPILNDSSSFTFYRLLGGLLGGTLLFALCLSYIITIIRFCWRVITHPAKRAWERSHQHLRHKATYSWKYRKQLFRIPFWRESEAKAVAERDVEKTPESATTKVNGDAS